MKVFWPSVLDNRPKTFPTFPEILNKNTLDPFLSLPSAFSSVSVCVCVNHTSFPPLDIYFFSGPNEWNCWRVKTSQTGARWRRAQQCKVQVIEMGAFDVRLYKRYYIDLTNNRQDGARDINVTGLSLVSVPTQTDSSYTGWSQNVQRNLCYFSFRVDCNSQKSTRWQVGYSSCQHR